MEPLNNLRPSHHTTRGAFRYMSTLTLCVTLALTVCACGSLTRIERDVHTITEVDTLATEQVTNQPHDRDNGIIYPSSRTISIERNMLQHDSIVEREYPGFIRVALWESTGLIGTQLTGNSTKTGLFGMFLDIDELLFGDKQPDEGNKLFAGYNYKVGIGEWKLNFLKDDPNWTYGLTAWERFAPDNDADNYLTGVAVMSVRKRFYFRNQIPYVAVTPGFHVAFYPSTYAHLNVAAEVGSISGVNLRLTAGYVYGQTSLFSGTSQGVSFPYLGVGVGLLDFLNQEDELEVEWKDHEHSGWEIGLVDFAFIVSDADSSFFSRKEQSATKQSPVKGFTVHALNSKIALPILDHRFYLGTSGASFIIAGTQQFAFACLPIRAGYFFQPGEGKFTIEPFAEVAFAPSSYTQLGVRAALPFTDELGLTVLAGYISGNPGSTALYNLAGVPATTGDFSVLYAGIGLSFFDKIFGRGDLRYGRHLPHE